MYNISKDLTDHLIKVGKELEDQLMWGTTEKLLPQTVEQRIRMAKVIYDNKIQDILIDPKTMIGYKTGDWYSPKLPLEEQPYNTFQRWYRGMDY